jgi:hypothetical protein
MIRFFLRFMGEKEKTQVIAKDLPAEARGESFKEEQNCAVFPAKWTQLCLKS